MPTYRFLVTSIDAYGHVNAVLGLAEGLKAAGHEICFVHREKNRHLAVKRGFSFIPLDETSFEVSLDETIVRWLDKFADKFRQEPLKRLLEMSSRDGDEAWKSLALFYALMDKAVGKIIADKSNEFDAIVADFESLWPSIYQAPIPWFLLSSLNPLILYQSGPPAFSGYSVNSDKSKWSEFREAFKSAHSVLVEAINANLKASGLTNVKCDPAVFVSDPQTIGFYHYPADLDYTECQPIRPNWYRIDAMIRQPDSDSDLIIPEWLIKKPGKLIYFSLGTLGSVDLVVLKNVIDILAKSPHKFIVSKGPRGDQLELASNMWGENYLNQIKVIEKVDLVITHGGNNTFMESLFHGKPMIVFPYFYDQFDNAQRVVDKKIGFRVNPYDLDEDYLLNCIEEIFKDKEMQNRAKAISENMRNSNSLSEAIKLIEKQIESSNNLSVA